jgi:hypothetical protein
MMYGFGPCDQPVGSRGMDGRRTPRWVHLALWVPFLLFIASALAQQWAGWNRPGPWISTLFLASIVTGILGYGAVLAACVFHLIKEMLARRGS